MNFRNLKNSIKESPILLFVFSKKGIALAAVLVFFTIVWLFVTSRPKTIVCKEVGKLSSSCQLKEWSKMKNLTIVGSVDSTDLSFLNEYACSLKFLDLSKTNIKQLPDSSFVNFSCLEKIVLPDSLQRIGRSVFSGCSKLTSAKLPAFLVTISEKAFWGTSITRFTVPATVNYIGPGALATSKMTRVAVAKDNKCYKVIDGVLFNADSTVLVQYPALREGSTYVVPTNVNRIASDAFFCASNLTGLSINSKNVEFGNAVFRNCSSLQAFSFPSDIDSIPASFFEGCVSLSNVELPENVSSISDYAFWNCSNLQSIKLPNTIKKIGDFSFAYCKSLVEVNIASVKSLGKYAFAYCMGLDSIAIPKSLNVISESAFCSTNLLKLEIPSNIQFIGDKAFSGCMSLREVKLVEGLKGVGSMSFSSCPSLESIDLPSSLVYIYGDCFYDCTNLSSIKVKAILPPECKAEFPAPVTTNCTLYAPYSSIPRYQFEVGWNKFFRVQSLNK